MAIFRGDMPGHSYSRYGNPTIDAVATQLARLESHGGSFAADALVLSSGMSAISTVLLGLLRPGDRILTQENLYGGTANLMEKLLAPLGIRPIMMDLGDLEAVADRLEREPAIRMIYAETPANPTLACLDLERLAELARAHACYTVADNTFCTPYIQQPLRHGFDFVIHSTTKFLNGHGNSIGGAIVARDPERLREKIYPVMKLAGTTGNPWDAWLLHNGLKTLALRMERHSSNALRIAAWLEGHPQVVRVNYPGLPSHPDHALASRQMRLGGGMLSFELEGGLPAAKKMIGRLRLCTLAPTLGDVDTLVLHPASMSHLHVDRAVRLRNGITDGLLRLSIGIEEPEDLIADLEQAMSG